MIILSFLVKMVKLRHRQPMQGSENTRCPANRSAMGLTTGTVRRATRKAHLLLLLGTFIYFALDFCATLAIVCKFFDSTFILTHYRC